MKFNFPINNFASGEWSRKMVARSDTQQYGRACESLKNSIVQMQGGAFRRPGTAYINLGSTYQAYLDANKFKLISIDLASGNSYVLVANDEKPTTGTNKWFIYNTDTGAIQTVTASTAADVADSAIDTCQFKQVGDVIFIVNPSMAPRYLKLESGTWNLKFLWEYYTDTAQYWKAYPFGPLQTLGIDGTISVTGTLTAGGTVALVSTRDQFNASMLSAASSGKGCLFKFTKTSITGVVEIATVTDSKHATATVLKEIPGASGDLFGAATGTAFEKALWNGYDGFPRALVPHQGRMYYGGSARNPDYVWGSRIGNVFDFMEVPFVEEDAFDTYANDNSRPFTLVPTSAEGSNIQGLSASKTLVINTFKSEIVAYGSQGALGPNDFNFESSTSYGAERVSPVRTNNYLVFVQRGARKIRDVIFSFDENQYKSNDLSFVADHLTNGDSVVEMMTAELLSSVLFCRTSLGKVNIVTLDRDYEVNAWAPFEFGGTYSGTNGTYAQCLGMCSVPGDFGQDDVFFLIKRTINGLTTVYLEKMAKFHEYAGYDGSIYPFPRYMDSYIEVTQSPANTVYSGFTHLLNETVQVIADGIWIGERTIASDGSITLPRAASRVMVGLKYRSVVRPMPMEAGSNTGSSVGRQKRVNDLTLRFYNSIGCQYGLPDLGEFYTIAFRDESLNSNALTELFSGDLTLSFPPDYARTLRIEVRSEAPFPCNILSIVAEGATYD